MQHFVMMINRVYNANNFVSSSDQSHKLSQIRVGREHKVGIPSTVVSRMGRRDNVEFSKILFKGLFFRTTADPNDFDAPKHRPHRIPPSFTSFLLPSILHISLSLSLFFCPSPNSFRLRYSEPIGISSNRCFFFIVLRLRGSFLGFFCFFLLDDSGSRCALFPVNS